MTDQQTDQIVKSKSLKAKGVEARKLELSKMTGIDTGKIQTVNLQFNVLRKNGLLIDLNLSGLSLFTRVANFAEMGILDDETDMRSSRLGRSQKFLIPEEYIKKLRSIETRMRQTLEGLTFEVAGFAPWKWLPFTAYDEWISRWTKLSAEHAALKVEILSKYDEFIDMLADDFAELAENSWKSLTAQGAQAVIVKSVGGFGSIEEFTEYVVKNAMSKMPTRETIENTLKADYVTGLFNNAEDVARDQAKAEEIRKKMLADIKKRDIELTEKEAAVRHQEHMAYLAEQEKQAKINAVFAAEMEHARHQLAEIGNPLEQVFTGLRKQIAEDAEEILQSVQKNKFMRGKVAQRGRGLLALFDLMAAHDDHELRAKLVALKSAIGEDGQSEVRNVEEITSLLEQIKDMEKQAVEDLKTAPSRFGMIDF